MGKRIGKTFLMKMVNDLSPRKTNMIYLNSHSSISQILQMYWKDLLSDVSVDLMKLVVK